MIVINIVGKTGKVIESIRMNKSTPTFRVGDFLNLSMYTNNPGLVKYASSIGLQTDVHTAPNSKGKAEIGTVIELVFRVTKVSHYGRIIHKSMYDDMDTIVFCESQSADQENIASFIANRESCDPRFAMMLRERFPELRRNLREGVPDPE